MTPAQARTEFTYQYGSLNEFLAACSQDMNNRQVECEQKAQTEARKRYPRVKNPEKKWSETDPTSFKAFVEPFAKAAFDARHENRARVDEMEAKLRALATVAEILQSEAKLKYADSWVSSYSTQGLGANTYAKNAAESKADDARANGISVDVRYSESPVKQYEVWVGVATDVDLAILRRKPGVPMREAVRLCWKRGVNPRVYWPFLPHGYEEREGINYQGNDLRAKQ